MTLYAHHDRAGDVPKPTDPGLLDTPLDFIAEEHERVRNMCSLIDYVTDRPETHPEIIAQVARFVRAELPVLVADEGEDLLPLMRLRCLPEDEIGRLRIRLDAEHDTAMYLLTDALAILNTLSAGGTASEVEKHLLHDFAGHLRRHLSFENAILLPLARVRLTADDIETLRVRMRQRRGLDPTTERTDDR